jgi:hypothetical protein
MRPFFVMLALVASVTGCQHIELRNHALRQAGTLTDLQYKQVLSNVAMFYDNPNSLPYFSATGSGSTTVTDTVNPSAGLNWDKQFSSGKFFPFQFDKASGSLSVTNSAVEGWSTASILNPDALLLMRCVYQMTVGAPSCACDCDTKVRAYFERSPCYLEAMRPGWFCVGRLKDVPKAAAYVGHCGATFVWVMPDGVDQLTRLTLAVLDIATAIKPGEAGHIDPNGAKIKYLSDKAKNLSDLLAKIPAKLPDGSENPIYNDLNNELIATLLAIDALYKFPPDQIAAAIQGRLGIFGTKPPPQFERVLQLLATPAPAETAPRDRRDFYNPTPFVIPVG